MSPEPTRAPEEVERFFERLFERAFPSPTRLRLFSVTLIAGRTWRLGCELDRRHAIDLDVAPTDRPFAARSRRLGFSHGEVPRGLARAALAACRRLAEHDDEPDAPDALFTLSACAEVTRERENVAVDLPGGCDRACLFCDHNIGRLNDAPAFWKRRRRRLSTMNAAAEHQRKALFSHIEAIAARGGTISWGGMDAMGSPLFDDALDHAHALGIDEMNVHGPGSQLVDATFVARLRARGIVQVGLTAHARSAALFDHLAGIPGAHDAFWAGLHNVLDAGLALGVTVPILRANLAELGPLFVALAEHDVGISAFYFHTDAPRQPSFDALSAAYPDVVAALEDSVERLPALRVTLEGIPPCALGDGMRAHFRWDYGLEPAHEGTRAFETLPDCARCTYAARCPKASSQYLRAFGPWKTQCP